MAFARRLQPQGSSYYRADGHYNTERFEDHIQQAILRSIGIVDLALGILFTAR